MLNLKAFIWCYNLFLHPTGLLSTLYFLEISSSRNTLYRIPSHISSGIHSNLPGITLFPLLVHSISPLSWTVTFSLEPLPYIHGLLSFGSSRFRPPYLGIPPPGNFPFFLFFLPRCRWPSLRALPLGFKKGRPLFFWWALFLCYSFCVFFVYPLSRGHILRWGGIPSHPLWAESLFRAAPLGVEPSHPPF